jgi:hypothetical protein
MLAGAGFLTNDNLTLLNNIEYLVVHKLCSDQRIQCSNM